MWSVHVFSVLKLIFFIIKIQQLEKENRQATEDDYFWVWDNFNNINHLSYGPSIIALQFVNVSYNNRFKSTIPTS